MAMDVPPEDEWEFVDFERVFSKNPGLAGVLENCEIQFRSAPDSPVQQLVDETLNNVPKLNDHPFDFRSKDVSRNNTAPGTPVHTALRVPSIHKTGGHQPSRLHESTTASPVPSATRKRTISGRELEITPRQPQESQKSLQSQQPRQPRQRNTSTSSTISDFGDDRRVGKLEKNRTSARECRRRKKEYISSLEVREKQLRESVEVYTTLLEERDEIIFELVADLKKSNSRWNGSQKVRSFLSNLPRGPSPEALATAAPKRKVKKEINNSTVKRAKF